MVKRRHYQYPWQRWSWRLGLLLTTVSLGWIAQHQLKAQFRDPQAILVLGGATEREQFAAELARQNPALQVWVSSGANPEYAEWLFQEADVDAARVHLDYRAVDTVTNFTTVVDDLKQHHIRSLYLVTSDYHMRRAVIIGQIVLGRHDITFQPLSVPSQQPHSESLVRGVRDGARALWWLMTGQTGASLGQFLTKS